jgi:hypothetical protein
MADSALRGKYIRPSTRIIAVVILVGFVVASFAVTALTIIHAGHNCAEKLCSLCPFILGKRLTEQLGRIVVVIAILSAALYAVRSSREQSNRFAAFPINLIEFNIRMND